jgi:hypothetical protein
LSKCDGHINDCYNWLYHWGETPPWFIKGGDFKSPPLTL